jgi:hypothetical protein
LVPARVEAFHHILDGAKHIVDAAGAYRLLDEIALAQRFNAKVAAVRFQVWKLAVHANGSATFVCALASPGAALHQTESIIDSNLRQDGCSRPHQRAGSMSLDDQVD